MGKYRVNSSHPEDFGGGRLRGPGEEIELTDEEMESPRVQALVKERKLTSLDTEPARQANRSRRGKEGD